MLSQLLDQAARARRSDLCSSSSPVLIDSLTSQLYCRREAGKGADGRADDHQNGPGWPVPGQGELD